MPDFEEGGGIYTQSLRIFKRKGRVNRKTPAPIHMLEQIGPLQGDLGTSDGTRESNHPPPLQVGLFCAEAIGFFLLLRFGDMGALKRREIALLTDEDGDIVLRVELHRSKTDQYNEGQVNVAKSIGRPVFPASAFSRRLPLRPPDSQEDGPVSNLAIRAALSRWLKCAAVRQNMGRAKVGTHTIRAGGESFMFDMGFELEVTKRWGGGFQPRFANTSGAR